MTSRNRARLIVTLALVAWGETAFSQDVLWNQPFSGDVVAGPFAIQSGKLPYCQDCDCPACKPDGCHGLVKRLFGRLCHRVRRCRRECYFNQQIYHTGYTHPVLPPYCEPGFGYFETSWRQPVPCLTSGPEVDILVPQETVPLDQKPIAPMPSDVETIPDPSAPGTNQPRPKYENGPQSPLPGDPEGDEKPPYEQSPPNDNAGVWNSIPEHPVKLSYPYQSFRR